MPRASLLLAMVLLSLFAENSEQFIETENPVRLPLYMKQYAKLHVGNPGKTITLRLRFDLDITYLYDDPHTYSDTFAGNGPPLFWNDIFYLDNVKLRLPVIYASLPGGLSELDPRRDTSDGVEYGGSFGIGRGSILWRYWTSATFSRYTMTLGRFDPLDTAYSAYSGTFSDRNMPAPVVEFYQRPFEQPRSFLASSDSAYCSMSAAIAAHSELARTPPFNNFTTPRNVSVSHTPAYVLPLEVRLEEEFTFLPSSMRTALMHMPRPTFHLLLQTLNGSSECANDSVLDRKSLFNTTTSHRDHEHQLSLCISLNTNYILTPLANRETIIRKSETNLVHPLPSGAISLGRITALDEMVVFVDHVSGLMGISPLFDAYPKLHQSNPHTFLSIFSASLWVWWIFAAHPMFYHWTRELLFRSITLVLRRRRQQKQQQQQQPAVAQATAKYLPVNNSGAVADLRRRKQVPTPIGEEFGRSMPRDNAMQWSYFNTLVTEADAGRWKTPTSPAAAAAAGGGSDVEAASRRDNLCAATDSDEKQLSFFERKFIDRYSPLDVESLDMMLHMVRVAVFWTLYYTLWGFESTRFAERLVRSANLPSLLGNVVFYIALALMVLLTAMCTSDFMERYASAGFYAIEVVLLLMTWLNQLPDMNSNIIDLTTNTLIAGVILARICQWIGWVLIRGADWIDTQRSFELAYYYHRVYPRQYQRPPPEPPVLGYGSGLFQNVLFWFWLLVLLPLFALFFYYLNAVPLIENLWADTPLQTALAVLLIVCGVVFFAFSTISKLHLQILYEIALRFKGKWEEVRSKLSSSSSSSSVTCALSTQLNSSNSSNVLSNKKEQ